MRTFRAILPALLALLLSALPAAAQDFPKLAGRVTDAAGIIPADVEARIESKLAALETQSQRQFVVATIPDLQGYDISDYGYRLGRDWGIGDKQRNDGALLIVAPNERKVRIEVGYGLEPVLTDGLSSLIIAQQIVPKFKAGDMPGGIEAGVDAVITQLTLPPDQAKAIAEQAQAQLTAPEELDIGTIIFFLFILFFFVLPLLRSIFGGRSARGHRGSSGGPIVWIPGGFSGGSGGGGFGGGGFSGGGGSFGGGGSSGSW